MISALWLAPKVTRAAQIYWQQLEAQK